MLRQKLPLRVIESPCLVAAGHGIKVYGHFLVELLFRLLIGRKTFFEPEHLPYRVLLDFSAPKWLLRILDEDLGVAPNNIEFFFPNKERVLVRHAFIPTNIFHDTGVNPYANELLDALRDRLKVQPPSQNSRRIFVVRNNFYNPESRFRICTNEHKLLEIAMKRHDFFGVKVEEMSWRSQIALFRDAEIVVGQAGSGLHNAMFSERGSRLASIGNLNFAQMKIGALRQQETAFLTRNINLEGEFSVDEAVFTTFLDHVCA